MDSASLNIIRNARCLEAALREHGSDEGVEAFLVGEARKRKSVRDAVTDEVKVIKRLRAEHNRTVFSLEVNVLRTQVFH